MNDDNSEVIFHPAEQGSPEWFQLREELAVTASSFGAVSRYIKRKIEAGQLPKSCIQKLNKSGYLNPPITPAPFSAFSQKIMSEGNRLEPLIRDWFSQSSYLEPGYEVVEVGIATNSKYPELGGSVDGLVTFQGKNVAIIEIKTVESLDYHRCKSLPISDTIKSSITELNYAQIQGNMAITQIPLCYYIVYGRSDNCIRVNQFEYDQNYWEQDLYPSLLTWIDIISNPVIS